MLVIFTTHPIQYQVPLWQALAADGRVPFEVWYFTHHALTVSHDPQFGKAFAWDLPLLEGYPHRLLPVRPHATPASFWGCQATAPLGPMLREAGAKTVWVQGWQVSGYWQAVWAARKIGCEVWLRGESNDLGSTAWWKRPLKAIALKQLFGRVDRFLTIGTANTRLYSRFGVPASHMYPAPYAVDNARFAMQAANLRGQRTEIRKLWGIAEGDFCVMFCGKFIAKKRPQDLIAAATQLVKSGCRLHLLLVGAGEQGNALREACQVLYDADKPTVPIKVQPAISPPATFAGFLNQTEISRAYVAADCMVLPSDHGETWGLVVNEAMASGVPCVISDKCGSAEDLGAIPPNLVFRCGDINGLADCISKLLQAKPPPRVSSEALNDFSIANSVNTVVEVWQEKKEAAQ